MNENMNDCHAYENECGDPLATINRQYHLHRDTVLIDCTNAFTDEHAPWKRTQQNTFTRWVNDRLKCINSSISDLENDLSNGVVLIHLVQVLSQKSVGKYHKKATFRSQQLENVSIALIFLEKDEGIKLVNIDSAAIVDKNLKLILGLIWTLILHYSISMPFKDDRANDNTQGGPKQKLLTWISAKVPISVKNFTSDWNDGRALGALVDSVAPGLMPEWKRWQPENKVTNTRTAMDSADEYLGVAKLITPEEFTDPRVDEYSMMTYLAQYPGAKLQPGKVIPAKKGAILKDEHMLEFTSDIQQLKNVQSPTTKLPYSGDIGPEKVEKHEDVDSMPIIARAFGEGVSTIGVKQNVRTQFTVMVQSGTVGFTRPALDIDIVNELGEHRCVYASYEYEPATRSFLAQYTPTSDGQHEINISLNGQPIINSPFRVNVSAAPIDISQVVIRGPGIGDYRQQSDYVIAGRSTWFEVLIPNVGSKCPEVSAVVQQPDGKAPLTVNVTYLGDENENHKYKVDYVPVTQGHHQVSVFAARKPVPNSPFNVNVKPATTPSLVSVTGRGVAPHGVRINDAKDDITIVVNWEKAGDSQPLLSIKAPDGRQVPVSEHRVSEKEALYKWQPSKSGIYTIAVLFGEEHAAKSPYMVHVLPISHCPVRVYGPGLRGGVANLPATFTVESRGEKRQLGFEIEGPGRTDIKMTDNNDGSGELDYLPKEPGWYQIHIRAGDEEIQGSPYFAKILPYLSDMRPSAVRVAGPGIERAPSKKKGAETSFTVNTDNAGNGQVDVIVLDDDLQQVDVKSMSRSKTVTEYSYKLMKTGKAIVIVSFAGVSVAGSPFRIPVVDPIEPSNVKLYGPGIDDGSITRRRSEIIIDTVKAGDAHLHARLLDANDKDVDFSLTDNHDGSHTLLFTPLKPGTYTLYIEYDGVQVPQSPTKIVVKPHVNITDVKLRDVMTSTFINSTYSFVVDAQQLTLSGGDKVDASITFSSDYSNRRQAHVFDNQDGTWTVEVVPVREGAHYIDVTYEGIPLVESPITVYAQHGCDPKKCRLSGDGLTKALVNRKSNFRIHTKGAGNGALELKIEGPSKVETNVNNCGDGSCLVEYECAQKGEYIGSVTFDGHPIPGSPFTIEVDYPIDPSAVRVYGLGVENTVDCRSGSTRKFNVDASKSGNAPLVVDLIGNGGRRIGSGEITSMGNGVYEVSYLVPPNLQGEPLSINVIYDDKHVGNSPYRMRVVPAVEPRKVMIEQERKEHFASCQMETVVDTRHAGESQLEIELIDPNGRYLPVEIRELEEGLYKLIATPIDVGEHVLTVKYNGEAVFEPIKFDVKAASGADRCYIIERPLAYCVGREAAITVNTRDAGDKAAVTVTAQPDYRQLELPIFADVQNNKNGTETAYFTPERIEPYTITVKYGGVIIPDGQWQMTPDPVEAYERRRHEARQENSRQAASQPSVEFWTFDIPSAYASLAQSKRKYTAVVTMPNKTRDQADVQENHDGTVTVKYQPKQAGQHEMAIKCNGSHIGGSPFVFVVDNIGYDSYVTAFGPGLSYATAGEPASFTIVAKDAGKGGLTIQVEGPAKANVSSHDNKDGTITVTWIPPTPGEYQVHVLYAGDDIQHSPFSARVAGDGRKRSQISVGSTSEVPLKISEGDIKLLSASIKSPSGIEEPCLIRKIDNNTLGVSFTPREVGEHLVTVKKAGAIIPGAPFRIKVAASDVGDASKVTCSGAGVTSAETQKFNQFTIDTSHAGYGGVSVSVEGPSRAIIECVENRDNRILMQWKPTEPGIYIVSIKFADHHVPGSPFTVKVTGQGVGTITEKISQAVKQAPIISPGQDVELQVRVPDTSAFDMCARLIDPEGKSEDVSLRSIGEDGLYTIQFKPEKPGHNALAITYRNQHVAGSPLQFTVGSFESDAFGGHRVRAGGPGLVHGETGAENAFFVYTREAGPGNLSFAIEGPDKAKIKWNELSQGNGFVSYKVDKEGEYVVSIKFNDKHIPESPYRVQITSNTGEARKLEIASFPDMNMPIGKPISFTVVTHHAKGKLDAKVTTPSNTTDDCFITPIDDDETYAVRYVPKEEGMYFFGITLDGSHMHNSPFLLRVGGKDEADPLAVVVEGKGIREGSTGQKLEYIVNTCNSGAGLLDIECSGPSKVTLDCYEVDVGYKVRYTPFAPGDYFMMVKYNRVHVPGSPFRIPIGGKSIGGSGDNESSHVRVNTVIKTGEGVIVVPEYKGDASLVECKGLGLKKTFAGRMSQFTVDASQSGPDILFVGVQSEKAGPASEVHVKHTGHFNYQVNYCVKDKGEFYIYVLYGNEHVPGSPFYIKA